MDEVTYLLMLSGKKILECCFMAIALQGLFPEAHVVGPAIFLVLALTLIKH